MKSFFHSLYTFLICFLDGDLFLLLIRVGLCMTHCLGSLLSVGPQLVEESKGPCDSEPHTATHTVPALGGFLFGMTCIVSKIGAVWKGFSSQ
jgi:hypothetical protein